MKKYGDDLKTMLQVGQIRDLDKLTESICHGRSEWGKEAEIKAKKQKSNCKEETKNNALKRKKTFRAEIT